uniref:Uncharacterized protein n=1 Tax=Knipowitschia caucasica TaxID=637954 RepID=A0AAV2K1C0_KNICA
MPLVVISQVDVRGRPRRTEGATGASVLDRSAGEPKPEQTPDGDWTGSRLCRHSRVAKERRVGLDPPPPPGSGRQRWKRDNWTQATDAQRTGVNRSRHGLDTGHRRAADWGQQEQTWSRDLSSGAGKPRRHTTLGMRLVKGRIRILTLRSEHFEQCWTACKPRSSPQRDTGHRRATARGLQEQRRGRADAHYREDSWPGTVQSGRRRL